MSVDFINIIGAGNLGKTLAKVFVESGSALIQGVCNRTDESASAAIEFIGQGNFVKNIHELLPSDITFITVPDNQIELCAKTLSQSAQLKKGSVVIHCSGVFGAEILDCLKDKGCFVASVHPMKSFANPDISVSQFKGTYCAIEGDQEAVNVAKPLFQKIGAKVFSIKADKKAIYHAAGVFASNYLVTLFHESMHCLAESGVEEVDAKNIVIQLMQSTLNNIKHTGVVQDALTGPIKRGDVATILKHIDAIENVELYRVLGLATLGVASLPPEIEIALKKLLAE